MKSTNKPRTKNSARENIDLFIQKKSEADSRLMTTKIILLLTSDDLITEKKRIKQI